MSAPHALLHGQPKDGRLVGHGGVAGEVGDCGEIREGRDEGGAAPRRRGRRAERVGSAGRWRGVPFDDEAQARDAALVERMRAAAPLRRALARLAGCIVRDRVWDRLGYARVEDYARERAGLPGSVLRELARVDSDLCERPRTEAAFLAGELSWTKARLVGRAGEPAEEEEWLATARRRTAEELAQEVRVAAERRRQKSGRAVAGPAVGQEERDEDGRGEEPYEKVELVCTAETRARLARVQWLARRAAGEPLPRWGAMEKMAAEVASTLPPDPDLVERFAPRTEELAGEGAVEDNAGDAIGVGGEHLPVESGSAAQETIDGPCNGGRGERLSVALRPRDPGGAGQTDSLSDPRSPRVASAVLGTYVPPGSSWILAMPADGELPEGRGRRRLELARARERASGANGVGGECSLPYRRSSRPDAQQTTDVAPPAFVAELTEGLEEASDLELDARLRRAMQLEQRWMADVGAELAVFAADRGYYELGFRSLDMYVRERLGMAPSRARALLRIERTGTASPAFRTAWRCGRLTWNQALVLAPVAGLPRAQRFMNGWIERAERVTLRRLEDDVEYAVEGERFDPAGLPALPAVPAGLQNGDGEAASVASSGRNGAGRMTDALEEEPAPAGLQNGDGLGTVGAPDGGAAEAFGRRVARRRTVRVRFRAPREVAAFFRAVLATVQRRVEHAEEALGPEESESRALDLMCRHALDEWMRHETPRLRREHAVLNRDNYRCSMPGCTSYRNLQAHHMIYRSFGGSDDMENQTALCSSHHQYDVHGNGRTRVRGRAPYALRFDLPVGSWRSGDVRIERARMEQTQDAC